MTQPYGIRKVVGAINAEGDAYWPAAMRRTYFEQHDLRKFLYERGDLIFAQYGVEFGCGYGRMLPVLREFADEVIGIERDSELARIALSLEPHYLIHCVNSFADVQSKITAKSVHLILTYTVLQHLTDEECKQAIAQMKRILDPKGFIVICEDTGGVSGPDYYQRTMEQYQDLFKMKLDSHMPRRFEDGRVVGQHMAFRWP
ncbi:methyltransferase domain-containing protein, partial [Patescibacteria group bacterium]|nr:methyltransferase domain-containing protein [Patescibacteria group bacterium]